MQLGQDTLTLTNADTEYSYQIPANCLSFSFKIRSGSYDLTYYFSQADAATKYFTLSAGSTQTFKGRLSPQTIYFKCSNAGEIVEFETIRSV